MRYSIRRFNIKHFENFDVREEQLPEFRFLMEHPAFQERWERDNPMFTLFYKEEPIMVYGMQNSGIGTYFPLVLASKGLDKHKFAVVRCIYDYVEKFVGDDLRRLEADVAVDDITAQKFVEFFGFEVIGLKRQSTVDGRDQIIYERLGRK